METDGKVHVVLDTIIEPFVHDIRLLIEWNTVLLAVVLVRDLHLVTDASELLRGVDIGHDTSVKHILDVFKEALMKDIVVREDKYCLQLVLGSGDTSIGSLLI